MMMTGVQSAPPASASVSLRAGGEVSAAGGGDSEDILSPGIRRDRGHRLHRALRGGHHHHLPADLRKVHHHQAGGRSRQQGGRHWSGQQGTPQ